MFGFARLGAILAGLSALTVAAAVPFEAHNLTDTAANSLTTRAKNAVPAPPHFVVYADRFVAGGAPPVAQVQGFNVVALSFWMATRGPVDDALEWSRLTPARRNEIKGQYSRAGIRLVVSLFGATDTPTSQNPTTVANNVATFVKNNNLDGVDVDYEDLDAMNQGRAEQWLITLTQQLRRQLPQSTYILTHAPLAPWFAPGKFPGGGFLKIHQTVGGMIDWYNLQFYNQGANEYTTCQNLLMQSSNVWPQTAIFQIGANNKVPLAKLVIGKPITNADATNGFMSPQTLSQCAKQAKGRGWNAGVMGWQWRDAGTAAWIRTVRNGVW